MENPFLYVCELAMILLEFSVTFTVLNTEYQEK